MSKAKRAAPTLERVEAKRADREAKRKKREAKRADRAAKRIERERERMAREARLVGHEVDEIQRQANQWRERFVAARVASPNPENFWDNLPQAFMQGLQGMLDPLLEGLQFPEEFSEVVSEEPPKTDKVEEFTKTLRQRLVDKNEDVQDAIIGLLEAIDRFSHVLELGKPTAELRRTIASAACTIADELEKGSRFEKGAS